MSYIKLAEAPTLVWQSPMCSVCMVDLLSEDGYLCPVCGTSWSYNDGDGDAGSLYKEWSGEEIEAEITPSEDAYKVGIEHERKEREASYMRWGWCKHGIPKDVKIPCSQCEASHAV